MQDAYDEHSIRARIEARMHRRGNLMPTFFDAGVRKENRAAILWRARQLLLPAAIEDGSDAPLAQLFAFLGKHSINIFTERLTIK